jgi:hypothetical protein
MGPEALSEISSELLQELTATSRYRSLGLQLLEGHVMRRDMLATERDIDSFRPSASIKRLPTPEYERLANRLDKGFLVAQLRSYLRKRSDLLTEEEAKAKKKEEAFRDGDANNCGQLQITVLEEHKAEALRKEKASKEEVVRSIIRDVWGIMEDVTEDYSHKISSESKKGRGEIRIGIRMIMEVAMNTRDGQAYLLFLRLTAIIVLI